MFVLLQTEDVIICDTLTKRKCEHHAASPCLYVHNTAASLWSNHYPAQVNCEVCCQDCKCLYYENCTSVYESTFALFPPSLRLEDGDRRAAPQVAANLCDRPVLVLWHAEHATSADTLFSERPAISQRSSPSKRNVVRYMCHWNSISGTWE
jgi:hypothetical protein